MTAFTHLDSEVLGSVLDLASEADAGRMRRDSDTFTADSHEPLIRAGWITPPLIKAAVELFEAGETRILRSTVSSYSHHLGSRPVSDGGTYALDVIDAFTGYEPDGSLYDHYPSQVSDAVRSDMRQHLRESAFVECWALIPASDMLAVLDPPWKDLAPFLTTSWVEAQKNALLVLGVVDWSTYDGLILNRGLHTLPPHESLIGRSAIEYTVDEREAHRGDGNTRAHALIAQGATTVLVHHKRPFGSALNGVPVSPEIVTL